MGWAVQTDLDGRPWRKEQAWTGIRARPGGCREQWEQPGISVLAAETRRKMELLWEEDDGGVSAVFKVSVEHSRHRTAPGWRRGLRPEQAGGGGGHGEPLGCAGCVARWELRSGSDVTSLLCWTGPEVSP